MSLTFECVDGLQMKHRLPNVRTSHDKHSAAQYVHSDGSRIPDLLHEVFRTIHVTHAPLRHVAQSPFVQFASAYGSSLEMILARDDGYAGI